jgi:SH3 domain
MVRRPRSLLVTTTSSRIKLTSAILDFPGTGEDEISFRRGEIIVVIAKDDGFGDGWWTVISLLPIFPPCLFISRVVVYAWIVCTGNHVDIKTQRRDGVLPIVKRAAVSSTLKP